MLNAITPFSHISDFDNQVDTTQLGSFLDNTTFVFITAIIKSTPIASIGDGDSVAIP